MVGTFCPPDTTTARAFSVVAASGQNVRLQDAMLQQHLNVCGSGHHGVYNNNNNYYYYYYRVLRVMLDSFTSWMKPVSRLFPFKRVEL